MRILVAEDEPDIRDFLQEELIGQGYEVDAVPNGKKALDWLKIKNFDVVLLDHDMPEMTGAEVAKFIKEKGINSKVVMMTGYPEMSPFFAKALGVDKFLTKPYKFNELLQIIASFIK